MMNPVSMRLRNLCPKQSMPGRSNEQRTSNMEELGWTGTEQCAAADWLSVDWRLDCAALCCASMTGVLHDWKLVFRGGETLAKQGREELRANE